MKRALSILIRIGISFLAMGILLFIIRKDIDGIFLLIKKAHPQFIFISLSLISVGIASIALRFKNVLKIQGIDISFNSALYLTLIGHFFNTFMPSAIGGDIVKAYYTSKKTDRGFEAFASVFADRFVGLLGVLTIAGISLAFYGRAIDNRRIMYAVLLMIAFCVFGILVMFSPALHNIAARYPRFQSVQNALKNLRSHKDLMITAFVISIGTQVMFISSVYFIAQSIGLILPLVLLFLALPVIWALTMLPSINGLGIREGAFVYFLGPVVGRDGAFAISLLWFAIGVFGVALTGGIAYAFHQIYHSLSGAGLSLKDGEKRRGIQR